MDDSEGQEGVSDGGHRVRAAQSLIFHQPESRCLQFSEAMGSAGVSQGSLESGVNEPEMGTKSGQWPRSPSEGEVLAQTMWQMANHTLGF